MSGIPWNHWPQYQGPLPQRPRGLWEEWAVRSSQHATCEVCQRTHGEHPLDFTELGYQGLPYLRVLCSGQRIKL